MSASSNSICVLDNNISIKGDIVSDGIIDVCGVVNGNINVRLLNVKNGSIITGKIVAEDIVIAKNGKIEGNIKAKSIKMLNGSYVKGEIYYNTLSIEDGSIIEGCCHYAINDKQQNTKDGKVNKSKDKKQNTKDGKVEKNK